MTGNYRRCCRNAAPTKAGWLVMHESGTYVRFTEASVDLRLNRFAIPPPTAYRQGRQRKSLCHGSLAFDRAGNGRS